MSEIVLVQPPIRDFYLTQKRTFPYGLSRIAASLRKAGFDVELIDALATSKQKRIALPESMQEAADLYGPPDASPFGLFNGYRHFGYSFEHLASRVRAAKPWLVGISSLFTAYSNEALHLAKTIKKFHPNCKIVLGGHHPTAFPETVLEMPDVDFVIRGDGEAAMTELAVCLRTGAGLDAVPGLAFRNTGGKTVVKEPAELRRIDRLPPPALDLIRLDFYSRNNRSAIVVAASRGCPMQCSYCCFGSGSGVSYRRMPWNAVMAEIDAALSRYDVGFIDFEDEHLSLDREGMIGFLEEFRERFGDRKIELRAMNGLYPPSLNAELVAEMRTAGFRTLNLSLGSTDPAQMKRFNRPHIIDAFDRCLILAENNGMDAVGYLLIAAPDQTARASLADLICLAEKRVLIGVSVYYPAPGSMDYAWCAQGGLLPADIARFRSTALPLAHRTTRIETVTLMRICRIINFIKRLADAGIDLKRLDPEQNGKDLSERDRIGIHLLRLFLEDGHIRGADPGGGFFFHRADESLVERFRSAIDNIRFRGVKT
ncbi:B12-binding domain-containing radical SAM protein [Desulfatirhabdium butyrativorans]|uniref:B12-binding domain-containing radical SAM protein n=1 Tax=Desulfatirhabdium butyrativorans TaxID=340467 RepID=UPI00040AEFBA|nr:radical SAM protein [Desulfatirhabdium butyrativorans]